MKKLNPKGFAHWILPLLVVVVIGGIGSYLYLHKSTASTTALSASSCTIRGRTYSSGVCHDTCQSSAGTYITSARVYNYCSGAVSTSISDSTCTLLGRKHIEEGCLRWWRQTRLYSAAECISNYATYYLAAKDFCNTTGVPPKLPSGSTGWVWPLPTTKHIGSGGYYLATGSKGYHPGIDIGATDGSSRYDAVKAAHTGYVKQSYNGGTCGWFMVISASGTSYYQGYQHLDPNRSHAGVGAKVTAGDTIGYVGPAGGGACGTSGFYHVHFSLERQNGLTFWNSSKSYVQSRTDSPCSVLPGC